MANLNSLFRKGLKKHEMGNAEGAAEHYLQVLKLKPNHIDALYMLGTLRAEQGRLVEAEGYLAQAARLNPASRQIHNNLANVYRLLGKLDQAIEHFRATLKLEPGFHDGRVNYAMALVAYGRQVGDSQYVGQAIQELMSVVDAQPKHYLSWFALGSIYSEQYDFESAVACYQKVLACKPDHYEAHLSLAAALARLGRFQEGMHHAEAAAALRPGDIRAITALASQHEHAGRPEEAFRLLEGRMREGERLTPAVETYVKAALHAKKGAAELQRAISILEDAVSRHREPSLYFQLGKVHDRLGQYGKAFECYRQGNDMLHRARPFDLAAHAAVVGAIKQAYSPSSAANLACSSRGGDNMIFIVGMPRSGSTLTDQILTSHPDVEGIGENAHLDRVIDTVVRNAFGGLYTSAAGGLSSEQLDSMADDYLERIPETMRKAKKISDKTVLNYRYIGFIKQLFPRSKILHCVRNRFDTCLSCYFINFRGTGLSFTNDLETLGRYYRLYLGMMAHWKSLYGDDILDVEYEALIDEPRNEIRRMLEFCGLEMHDACLSFHENPRFGGTPSYQQVRQPLFSTSIKRYENYREFLGPLCEALEEHV